MEISKQDAEQSLAEIQKVISQTQRALASGCSSPLLILWGAIWFLGYSSTQFFPQQSRMIWLPLTVGGSALSWLIGVKWQTPLKSPHDAKIGYFWLILFAYSGLWVFLLKPTDYGKLGAYMATIPMFGYVVGGLWFGRFFVYLGLTVTILTVAGTVALPSYFSLWMAFTGGGSLMAAGLYIRKYWR